MITQRMRLSRYRMVHSVLPTQVRPLRFALDPDHSLSIGNVLMLGGCNPGTVYAEDSSGYFNRGTLTNMDPATDWLFDPELGRYVLDFDGNDCVIVPSFNTTDFTIAVWSRPRSLSAASLIYKDENLQRSYGVGWGNAANKAFCLVFKTDLAYTIVDSMTTGTTNIWWHIVATYRYVADNTSVLSLYMNGELDKSVSNARGPVPYTTSTVQIAAREFSSTRFFHNGIIADPCIWNRVLSPSEIQILADRSDPMLGGWIYDPSRTVVSFAGTGAATKYWTWARQHQAQVIGGGAL